MGDERPVAGQAQAERLSRVQRRRPRPPAIIRALRAANYSLAAILRLLDALDRDATADIGHVLDHPDPDDDILSVCDRLLTSLDAAERNAFEMIELLERMKKLA